jgi:hypothetical protein
MSDRPDFRFIVGTEGIALPALMAGAKSCTSRTLRTPLATWPCAHVASMWASKLPVLPVEEDKATAMLAGFREIGLL